MASFKAAYLVALCIAIVLILLLGVLADSEITPFSVDDGEPRYPMVLSEGFWEQTANGLKNLIDLQCWASSVGISMVVEPKVLNGVFGFSKKSNSMSFGDLFDLAHWNNASTWQNHSHLVPVEDFFRHAVRDMVYVYIKYATAFSSWAFCPWFRHDFLGLKAKGFRVARIVCIDLRHKPQHAMSVAEFRDAIFKDVGPNVTVVFHEWRGIRADERVAINGSKCANCLGKLMSVSSKRPQNSPYNDLFPLVPSQRIHDYVETFTRKYLSGGHYVVVMLRSEKLNGSILSTPPKENPCIGEILSDWEEMRSSMNVTKSLFFSDTGKYGSVSLYKPLAQNFSNYVYDKMRSHLAVDDVNSVLQVMTNSGDSVQMAILHQQLAARASCVLLVGQGSFQSHTLSIHAHLRKECYVLRDGNCKRKISRIILPH